VCRRCGEPDRRGSAVARRKRKQWLLDTFGWGSGVKCWYCPKVLTLKTVTQDRIVPGGPYRRSNLLPACLDCNIERSNRCHDSISS